MALNLALALAAIAGGTYPAPPRRRRNMVADALDGRWRDLDRPTPRGPITVTCPRCYAAPGEGCDPRTLGRHNYHMARVRAWETR